jgi:hypothetical protein
MFTVTFGEYSLCVEERLPLLYKDYCKHAQLAEEDGLSNPPVGECFVAVKKRFDWPFLVVAQHYSPGGYAGFYPGALIVPETHLLFIGAGTRLLAYTLDEPAKLWEDSAEPGFWAWERCGEAVIMSGELEVAVWDITGQKRWTRYVEPPWSYTLDGDNMQLDVMGKQSTLSLKSGSLVSV